MPPPADEMNAKDVRRFYEELLARKLKQEEDLKVLCLRAVMLRFKLHTVKQDYQRLHEEKLGDGDKY